MCFARQQVKKSGKYVVSEWFDILSLLLAAFESNLRVECATRDVKIELEREID